MPEEVPICTSVSTAMARLTGDCPTKQDERFSLYIAVIKRGIKMKLSERSN
jgi:hypothetical protein